MGSPSAWGSRELERGGGSVAFRGKQRFAKVEPQITEHLEVVAHTSILGSQEVAHHDPACPRKKDHRVQLAQMLSPCADKDIFGRQDPAKEGDYLENLQGGQRRDLL